MSFSAKAAVLAMRFAKRLGLFPKVGDLESETAKAKEYNKKHPYKEPSDHKALYSTEYVAGYPVLTIRQHVASHKKALLFLHGGEATRIPGSKRYPLREITGSCLMRMSFTLSIRHFPKLQLQIRQILSMRSISLL